jgi:hypothetical protein
VKDEVHEARLKRFERNRIPDAHGLNEEELVRFWLRQYGYDTETQNDR